MAIRSVEIICLPCAKCDQLKTMIINTIKNIEIQGKAKIVYDFKITPNLRDVSKYGLNPSQTPILVVNGTVESAGKIDLIALKNKLSMLHRS